MEKSTDKIKLPTWLHLGTRVPLSIMACFALIGVHHLLALIKLSPECSNQGMLKIFQTADLEFASILRRKVTIHTAIYPDLALT